MSRRYEQFQSLDQETKPKTVVRPPEDNRGTAPPTSRAPAGMGLTVRRLCVGLLIVIAVVMVAAVALPWWLSKLGQSPTVTPVRRDPVRQTPPQQPRVQPAPKPESDVERDAAGEVVQIRVVEPDTAQGTTTQVSTTDAEPQGGFITSVVEVVTSSSEPVTEVAVTATTSTPQVTRTEMSDDEEDPLTVSLTARGPAGAFARRTGDGTTVPYPPTTPEYEGTGSLTDDFTSDFDRGVQLQRGGELEEAMDYYERHLSKHVGHPGCWNNMGIIFQRQGKYDKAIGAYAKAIAAYPDNFRTYNNMAICYLIQMNYKRAAEALIQSLELEPGNYEALINMGVAQTALRRSGEAEMYLKRAIEKRPGEGKAYYNLGYLNERQEKFAAAADYYVLFLARHRGRYVEQEKRVRKFLGRQWEEGFDEARVRDLLRRKGESEAELETRLRGFLARYGESG